MIRLLSERQGYMEVELHEEGDIGILHGQKSAIKAGMLEEIAGNGGPH